MRTMGFTVEEEPTSGTQAVKTQLEIPASLHGCHTAIVDGYVVEGHVPAEDIERMLTERPDVIGIAVPGMPIGSPGMEIDGVDAVPYEVIAFRADGTSEVFASH